MVGELIDKSTIFFMSYIVNETSPDLLKMFSWTYYYKESVDFASKIEGGIAILNKEGGAGWWW